MGIIVRSRGLSLRTSKSREGTSRYFTMNTTHRYKNTFCRDRLCDDPTRKVRLEMRVTGCWLVLLPRHAHTHNRQTIREPLVRMNGMGCGTTAAGDVLETTDDAMT
jgi:hypothetical protein